MSSPATVVPFRLSGLSRLSDVLDPAQRRALATAMLSDVVATVRDAGLAPTIAAADEASRAAVASTLPDVACALDPIDGDLDGAVAVHAAAHPDGLLVVMADLPALSPAELHAVLEQPASVVVAESSDGGTGALLRRPATVIGTAYGARSARRHADLAVAAGVAWIGLHLPGFLAEIDRPEDLTAAADWPLGPSTAQALQDLRT
ncbi:MAG: 2-phospho-L-lactate guanylyltransferase [Nitriliruptorales bacterium]|nr:2-phospho-L-lactate guanylyltransferase [Nitriliruptorales bacterium]